MGKSASTQREANDERVPTPLEDAQRLVTCIDAFMVEVCGYPDPAERTDEHGRRHFNRGSASGIAWVEVAGEGEEQKCLFHAAARVMDLPSDRELLLPFYRELLEINWVLVGVARLAVTNSAAWVVFSDVASRVESPLQVAVAIDMVMGLADGLDDQLVGKYGGTSAAL